ncbi:MAG: FAD-dependent oxidoreductase, partial [Rhodobacteraceae bacterium]|nr:FAD-dependent oxidoreductase [Paracoccaceae bacterium]
MTDRVRALVVGGGVVGVSIAYHLAKAGWQETMLIERDELTSGSTWHAAGLLPLFNLNYSASHIHRHSISLYRTLENETGLDPGFRPVGNLRMAQTEDRMREYMLYASTADTIDIPYAFLTPAEIAERYPLVRTDDLRGAIFHPTDGYINPADLTQALARGARQQGVTIQKRRQLDAMEWTGSEWIVSGSIMLEAGGNLIESPERFAVHTEHVIMATGNHAQRTAAILGITSPAIPVEHQYIVTDVDPVLAEWRKENPEHPVLRDPDARWYLREERGGWLLGPYEDGAPARFAHGVPKTFRSDLFNLDLDRIEAEYQSMLHRVPSSEQCGLKGDFNGPICYTPDGNPLLGPAPGLRNVWLAEGFSFGVTTAGGAGYYLAQTIVDGEAGIDMISFDPRRFGDWITKRYAIEKNEECYATFLKLHHPDEERPACRPLRCAPCYDRLRSRGAQFGQVNGWERPNYFAPQDFDDHAARSFHQGGWWPYARAEASAVRSAVGILDATAFAKHEILGPGATQFLDWYTANRLPSVGRVSLTHALTPAGTVCSEFTVARLAGDRYFLVSAGAWASYDGDCLRKAALDKHVEFGPIEIRDVSTRWGCFVLAGPNARSLMTDLLEHPDPATALCNENFPWLAHRTLELGMCPVRVLRVSYTGSPGWELYHPLEMQNYLFDLVERHGAPHKLKDFGARAQNWLRMEKSYRAFGAELGRDITLHEAGLERFIDN